MKQYAELLTDVLLTGNRRETRSGQVISTFKRDIQFDLRKGLPLITGKKLPMKSVIGELLWFLNGETDLPALRYRSNLAHDAWTIWTPDCQRWNPKGDDLGKIYGSQWRTFGTDDFNYDQITDIVDQMMLDPTSRYMVQCSWNVKDIYDGKMALPPCHMAFQVYVEGEYFDLDWTQRSVDVFLGLPFNIASYALLMHILGRLTGLKPRYLYGSLKDVHVYDKHIPMVQEYLARELTEQTCGIELPDFTTLDELDKFTARDFVITDYNPQPAIKAPLEVG